MFLRSKVRRNTTVALMLEEFIAAFPEAEVEWPTEHKWHLKVNDGKFFTLVSRNPYINLIYSNASFNAIKHLEYSIGRN